MTPIIFNVPAGYKHVWNNATSNGLRKNEKVMQLLHVLGEQIDRNMMKKKNRNGLRVFPRSVPLSARLLEKWIGHDYDKAISDAKDFDFVEVYGMVGPGRSKRYRFGAAIHEDIAFEKYIVQHPANQKRIAGCLEERALEASVPWVDVDAESREVSRILLDSEAAEIEVTRTKTESQRHSAKMTIALFKSTKREAASDQHGRVHSPLTTCKRAFRNFMTVDGEPIACVDIACSQFTLMGVLAREWLANGRDAGRLIRSVNVLGLVDWKTWPNDMTPTLRTDTTGIHTYIGVTEDNELVRFLGLCTQKDLYESVAKGYVSRKVLSDRDLLKALVYSKLLFANRPVDLSRKNTPRIVRAFAERFPMLHEMIQDFRRPSGRRGKKWHTYLPETLQRIESQIVHGIALPTFRSRHVGEFVTAIHDSLVVKASMVEEARQCLVDAFSAIGWQCRLKIETEWASAWDSPEDVSPVSRTKKRRKFDADDPNRVLGFVESLS